MKSRQVSFFIDLNSLPSLMTVLMEEVLPGFRELPHFLGFTVLKSDSGTRTEIVGMSYWDDDLEGSEETAQRFVEEVHRLTGASPSRKRFDILYATMRDTVGGLQQESV